MVRARASWSAWLIPLLAVGAAWGQAPAGVPPRPTAPPPAYPSQPRYPAAQPSAAQYPTTQPAAAPLQPTAAPPPPGYPSQPGGPTRPPLIVQRSAAPTPAPAPFTLTPEQEAALERALAAWEQRSQGIQRMTCGFTKFEKDLVFNKQTVREGELKYQAPDKGLYRVLPDKGTNDSGEYWVCDGKSIFQFDAGNKQLVERKLPPHLQGQAIADGPLPFLFGQTAAKLKRRYFLRLITPPDVKDQVWLQAYPRYQQDAGNFTHAEMILNAQDMLPFAIQIHLPGGKQSDVYRFTDMRVNAFQFLPDTFYRPRAPFGWKQVTEDLGQPQPPEPRTAQNPAAGAPSPSPSGPLRFLQPRRQ